MATFASNEAWDKKVTVSGTVTLPSNFGFTATDGSEYDVICVEGVGTVDEGTKTEVDFDVTVTGASATFRVLPKKIGAVAQVS